MFAGLMGLHCNGNAVESGRSLLHHYEVTEGGAKAPETAGESCHKRPHRRPGYMRADLPGPQSTTSREEAGEIEETEGRTTRTRNGGSGCPPPGPMERSAVKGAVSHRGHTGQSGTPGLALNRHCPAETTQSPGDSFSSSFSFIQQSLSANEGNTTVADTPLPLLIPGPTPGGHSQREELFWQGGQWGGRMEALPDLADGDEGFSLATEFHSSLSVDSDTASSVTSGYESATPASEQGWDHLVKKYEGVLQDCLQSNRANTKIESMMLKLQRLQQKAILDDDYDTAERFGKKLGELCRERGALKLGLPSRQPSVATFLQRLTQAVNSALQRAEHRQRRKEVSWGCGSRGTLMDRKATTPRTETGPLVAYSRPAHQESSEPDGEERSSSQLLTPRDCVIQEKRLVEAEMVEMQRRLAGLQERHDRLELCDMSRTLRHLVTSHCRSSISMTPSASVLRLQEQEKALNLSIKEATAKVVMSQRLGGSLRRKVSETETQLLALHEAKLAAISGNDFGSAKELKTEMKTVYQERDRLEGLARRLHSLSCGNSQELARMKEQQQQLRAELEQREAQHERLLKDNVAKYMELLEDRLHSHSTECPSVYRCHGDTLQTPASLSPPMSSTSSSEEPGEMLWSAACGCPPLEKVWEADLEACHLFLRGLQLRTPSYSGADSEEPPSAAAVAMEAGPLFPLTPTSTKEEEEEDCAMLTALGGRWCPEANLQHSEFTKVPGDSLDSSRVLPPSRGGSK
ncbi:hypothetical protein NHX12_021952 [Muraenolepis orangiensis]|uniref:DISC1 scaffold protein n=1 Tax=Muraenolepis orangiensis TaxID=630683 RepID=A0A9Q0EQN7_9TELE|nr:hypothetical protein NHX12_021952 [Muraenolepis orangiensis]